MDLHDYNTYQNYGNADTDALLQYLTQQQGFQNSQSHYAGWYGSTFTLTDLVGQLDSGKLCFVVLRAEDIWASNFAAYDAYGHARDADHDYYLDAAYVTTGNAGPPDHAVWVRGFQRDTNGNITHVICEDSGPWAGAFAKIPVNVFLRAWGRTDSNGVYDWAFTVDPPSGYSWSSAGINTWNFNPGVWSTSW
jgi:hypothetical protein